MHNIWTLRGKQKFITWPYTRRSVLRIFVSTREPSSPVWTPQRAICFSITDCCRQRSHCSEPSYPVQEYAISTLHLFKLKHLHPNLLAASKSCLWLSHVEFCKDGEYQDVHSTSSTYFGQIRVRAREQGGDTELLDQAFSDSLTCSDKPPVWTHSATDFHSTHLGRHGWNIRFEMKPRKYAMRFDSSAPACLPYAGSPRLFKMQERFSVCSSSLSRDKSSRSLLSKRLPSFFLTSISLHIPLLLHLFMRRSRWPCGLWIVESAMTLD